MDKDIEKLIKIQGAINKDVYHLYIETDLILSIVQDMCNIILQVIHSLFA